MSSTAEEARERAPEQIDVDSIRAQFNDIVARDGRSLAQIAPETGVAYGTLHPWAKAIYKGNNARIAGQVSTWITTRDAREKMKRSVRPEPPFVMTQTASRIWETLEFAQSLPDMVLITGGAGIGKTSAIEAYRNHASNVFIMTAQPFTIRIGTLLECLADTLGVREGIRFNRMHLNILGRLRGTRGLLIIDEAQWLPAQVREQLRSTIYDAAKIGVALVGNDEMNATFRKERQEAKYAQLTRRIGQRFNRDKPFAKDVQMLLDAWGVDNPDARTALTGIAMKPGASGQMCKTLRMAFTLADARGDETPTAADIEACYRQLGGEL